MKNHQKTSKFKKKNAFFEEMKKVAVHSGSFHADEVFGVAILKLIYPKILVIRTRDEEEYNKADARLDVGKKYDPKENHFDHHQKEGAGNRENGIPYATAGLIWKHFGDKLVKDKYAFQYIDEKLMQSIDAGDNGVSTFEVKTIKPYLLSDVVASFNPKGNASDKRYDKEFKGAVRFAIKLLKKELETAKVIGKATKTVLELIKKSNGKYLVLEKMMPWKKVVSEESDIKYVIHPSASGQWRLTAVPISIKGFELKRPLPAKWGGLDEEKLVQVTGVKDAKFCHRKLFCAGANTKKAAIELAKLALQD